MKKIVRPILTTLVDSVTKRLWKEKFHVMEHFKTSRGSQLWGLLMEVEWDFEYRFNQLIEIGHPDVCLVTLEYRKLLFDASIPEIIEELGGGGKFEPVPFSVIYSLMAKQTDSESSDGQLLFRGGTNIFPMVLNGKGKLCQLRIRMCVAGGCIDKWNVHTAPGDASFNDEEGDRVFLIPK